MANAGFIYVAFNPEMPHCVKVGLTTREPRERLRELSGTSTPVPFRLLMGWRVTDTIAAERVAHAALADCRVASNREFFRSEGPDAIRTVGQAIEPYLVVSVDSALRDEIKKACEETAKFLFTRDFRSIPPVSVSPEVTEALQLEICGQALWLAEWATEHGGNATVIVSVIDLVSAQLDGPPQTQRSPAELAREFNAGMQMLTSLLFTSFYLRVGVGPFAAPALKYAAEISRVVAHAIELAEGNTENGG